MNVPSQEDHGNIAPGKPEQDRHGPLSANADRQERLRHALSLYGSILLLGLAYLVFCLLTGLRLPCPIYTVTGLLCPGCGITRMMLALARLDFSSAFAANPLLFVTGPVILGLLAREEYLWVQTGVRPPPPEKFYKVLLVCFIIFTVWRNWP